MYTSFIAPLLPILIASLALSKTQVGLLILFLQGPALFQPVIGHVVDRLGLKPMVYLGPAITAVGMSLAGVTPSYTLLAVLLTLVGINSALFHSVGSVMSGSLSGKSMGRGAGLWMFGAEFGRTLGPLLIVGAVGLWTPRSLPWLMIIGLAGSVLLYLRLRNLPFRPARAASKGEPWLKAMRRMSHLMLPILGVVTARGFLVSALGNYLPTFLYEEGASLTVAGVSLSVFEAAGTVGALFGGAISDRLGRKRTVLVSLLVCVPLMGLFLMSTGWLRMLSLVGLGFFLLSNLGVIMALVQESFPEDRALANGLYLASYFVAGSVMSVVVGWIGDRIGLRSAYAIGAFTPLLGAALLFLLPRGRPNPAPTSA
jgi:FSR family fosmidomycin resistance protein-like MFS transporter